MRFAYLAFLGLVGCDPAPEVTLDVEVVAPRDRRGERLVFDHQRLPALRFATVPSTLSVVFVSGESTFAGVEHSRHNVGPSTIVRFAFAIPPPRSGLLTVRTDTAVRRIPALWAPPPREHPAIAEIVAMRSAGELEEALEALESRLAGFDENARMWALAERARLYRRLGRGAVALEEMLSAAKRAQALDHPLEAADRWTLASFYALGLRRYDVMAEAIHSGRTAAGSDTNALALADLYQGQLARALGQYGAARRAFTLGVERATWVANARLLSIVSAHLVDLELELGLFSPRLDRPPVVQDNARHEWDAQRARLWLQLAAMERCALRPDWPPLRAALDDSARAAHPDASAMVLADAQLYRTFAAWLAGDVAAARDALTRARAAHPDGGEWPELADQLHGELLLAEGATDAAVLHFTAQSRAHLDRLDLRSAWPALHGLGRALHERGDPNAALAAWSEASETLSRLARSAPLHGGRSGLLGRGAALVDDMVSALVASGRTAEAFEVVERHRAPVLRQLHTDAFLEDPPPGWSDLVADWQREREAVSKLRERCAAVPLEEVPACRERLASAHRRARQALDTATERLPDPAPHASTAAIAATLRPGEALLTHHPRVARQTCAVSWHRFLLADGTVHYLPPGSAPSAWGPLLADRAHVYRVDGGPSDPVTAPSSRIPWAGWLLHETRPAEGPPLVVADARRDLPHSARAARDIAESCNATLLEGPAATRARFAESAKAARWIHYDGHGVLDPNDPWAAHLPLADGQLTITDVLTSPARPRTVVLAGCETALASDLGGRERVSLAHAFLLAGARTVVATDRRVADADSARFVRLFHATGGPTQPGPAFTETIAQLKRAGDPAWEGWRLFGRP